MKRWVRERRLWNASRRPWSWKKYSSRILKSEGGNYGDSF
jgi:hypothetical protein